MGSMVALRISFFVAIFLMMSVGLRVDAKEGGSPAYLRYVSEVISAFEKEMYRDYGLKCKGTGGRMPHDVEKITVNLFIYQNATVEQARELEVRAIERFAQIINAHEKIRPFLREYPFPSNRIDVSISFDKPKKKKTSSLEDDVAFVFQAKGKIFYRAYNPENPYLFQPIKDEPYEEALKIVQENAAKEPVNKSKKI
jgi:hypothetical protein